jgi:hypothetical protein
VARPGYPLFEERPGPQFHPSKSIRVALAPEDHVQQIDDPNDYRDGNCRTHKRAQEAQNYSEYEFEYKERDHRQDEVHYPGSDALTVH